MDNMDPESATTLVDDLRAGKEVRSSRGPRVCTWREAERVLAGFPDGLADEGPAAGPPSLVGLGIARERGWKAPRVNRREVEAGEPEQGALFEHEQKTGASREAAATGADTSRAESESKVDESAAGVEGGKGSNPEAGGKGTNQ
jgi:NADH-quinone oxidoreductase subunit E